MGVFKSKLAQEVWTEHWCARCYRMPGGVIDQANCSILSKALRTNRKPKEWERNPRADTMAGQAKCLEYNRKPPRSTKTKQYEDVSMFDDDTLHSDGRRFVPVDGWPDSPDRTKGVDHA